MENSLTEAQKIFLGKIQEEFISGFHILNQIKSRNLVTIYGSARLTPSHVYWQEINDISIKLRGANYTVISGGGPGIMSAALANDFAQKQDTVGFGIDINRELQQSKSDLAHVFDEFFVRKYFLRISEWYIIAPGGWGTMDEGIELLTLLQTKKRKVKGVILYKRDFWKGLQDWFTNTLLKHNMIQESDLELYHTFDSPQEVIEYIVHTDNVNNTK